MAPRTRFDLGRTAQGSGVSSIALNGKRGRSATLQTKVTLVLVGAVNSQAVISNAWRIQIRSAYCPTTGRRDG
jgi:hypothetical protein